MKTLKQLLRKPVKSLFGVLLTALGVAALAVCLCQSLAAEKTGAELEFRFTTVALPTSNYNFKYNVTGEYPIELSNMNPDLAAWIDEQIAAHPELVETVASPGLASAYIPALTVDNHSRDDNQEDYYERFAGTTTFSISTVLPGGGKYAASYGNAMFLVTLTEIGDPADYYHTISVKETGKTETPPFFTKVTLYARIDQVIGLEEGFEDPTGQTITLTLTVDTLETLEKMALTVGEQYMVNGSRYYWGPAPTQEKVELWLRSLSNSDPETAAYLGAEYDSSLLHILTEEQKATFRQNHPDSSWNPAAVYGDLAVLTEPFRAVYQEESGSTGYYPPNCILLKEEDITRTAVPAMILYDETLQHEYDRKDASLIETREIIENGETVTISWEEYKERYGIPTIEKLEGSVEDFLAENADWQQALHNIEVNYHTFPIIGVEKLSYIADFARGLARVTQGRDFTKEELESGAKVCILSEQIAQLNGLQVGDTIHPQFYNYDYNIPYQYYTSEGPNTVMPNAYYYSEGHTEFDGDPVEYTVIGLYRQDSAWGDARENLYSFTPNTIFVPETSVTSDMDYGTQGVFRTVILKNGCIEEFDAIISQHGFAPKFDSEELEAVFVYYDQGYSQVKESFYGYRELAKQVLIVGVTVYGIILILFLLLYPARQGGALRTMASLGTPRWNRLGHVLLSALGILLPGTVLGCALALVLWGPVVSRLLTAGGAAFSLSLDLGSLAFIAAAQFLLALTLVLLTALPMTRQKSLMKRK